MSNKKVSISWKDKARIKLELLANKVPYDKLYDYYEVKNNNWKACQEYFKITNSEFIKILKYYNIRKSKESHSKLIASSKELKYGDSTYNNRIKAKSTCIERYGVDNPFRDKDKIESSYTNKLGVKHPMLLKDTIDKLQYTRTTNYGTLENSYKEQSITYRKTCLNKYGVENASKLKHVKEKIAISLEKTFSSKYNTKCYWTTKDAKRSYKSVNSKPNLEFANLLDKNNIEYEREFVLGNHSYDFKVGRTLIEINPSATHNSTWGLFDKEKGLSRNYHYEKSELASINNYRCLHIFDWDNKDKLLSMLKHKSTIFARKCIVKEINKEDAANFLNTFHFQNSCRNQSILLGLYYKDRLVQLMTFGKPRYNKNYEYELLRLCSHSEHIIVGGSNKLFKYFLNNYNPNSIISYCDKSKFSGNVYKELGFSLKTKGLPSKHWHNLKDIHITDNMLRQRGFDQLFGNTFGVYGKGSNNDSLMREHGFVEIYDCGQSTFVYTK